MQPFVTALHIAPAYGSPVVAVDEVVALAGHGLEGDRYLGSRRQVTIVCTGELAHAAADLGFETIPDGATRRNVTVAAESLPRTHGARIRLGEAELAVWRDCPPCEVMEDAVASGARRALRHRAGVSATVVAGGTIRVGDPVVIA